MKTLADFIGLPFADHGRSVDGADCWGGVRLVLRELRGLVLPDYGSGYEKTGDVDGISVAIRDGLVANFHQVDRPTPFDLVIFNLCGKPWHVGLVVGRGRFLHWPEGQSSRIEYFTERKWKNRVEGFYRYAH